MNGYRVDKRITATVVASCVGFLLATTASAVDLRDWGRKFPTSQRFVVLTQFNNKAVLDKETQLVWQRTPPSNTATWQSAKHECVRLAIAGRRGWRLPSVHELTSLTRPDAPVGQLSLPAGHPFINVPQVPAYWTASFLVHPGFLPTEAYVVSFSGPALPGIQDADVSLRFWCVRGSGEF